MAGESSFNSLKKPIRVGSLTLKNRVVMAPMGTSFAGKYGLVTDMMKDYYEARARGGVGLVIVENASVDFHRSQQSPYRLAIDSDIAVPGLASLARAIKRGGARAVIQINYPGPMSKSKLTGFPPVGPSPIPAASGETPREMTAQDIKEVVALFASAARRAKRAGFDGVEVHAAHGYLLAAFLSPHTNHRHDAYGGSLENRARFLMEVLQAIRHAAGKDLALLCRINGQEFGTEDGLTREDAAATARIISGVVDAVHVSAWGRGRDFAVNMPDVPGALLPLAEAIKKSATVQVIGIGRLTPEVADEAIRDGKIDLAAMGRALLADPELPGKALSGHSEDIRPCISCFHCTDTGVTGGVPVLCTVNGALSRERELLIKPARKVKQVAVIGAGPAGMETSRVLASRGHKVVLFEKEGHCGGQMHLAMMPPHKRERIEPFMTYLTGQVERLGVTLKMNTEAGTEAIESLRPDAVILATGAIPIVPKIPGADLAHVVSARDVLSGRANTGKRVVVIGGGSTGCETAEYLFEMDRDVAVVEMLPELAGDMGFRDRLRLLNRLEGLAIRFITGVTCRQVHQKGVLVCTKDNKEQFIDADTVVLAVGQRPVNNLFPLLRAKGFETYMAGDCWHIGRIADAISDGLRLGCTL